MRRLLRNILLTLWLGFLTAAAFESHSPVDLSQIHGLDAPTTKATPDVMERMERSIWRRNDPLVLTEAEVNHYLTNTLTGKQIGITKLGAKFERVAVKLEPGLCRVYFIWSWEGHQSSASLDLTVTREKDSFITEVTGGSYGRLPLLHRGALATLMPACTSLTDALQDELHMLFQMNQIHFEKDKVVLDPRFESAK